MDRLEQSLPYELRHELRSILFQEAAKPPLVDHSYGAHSTYDLLRKAKDVRFDDTVLRSLHPLRVYPEVNVFLHQLTQTLEADKRGLAEGKTNTELPTYEPPNFESKEWWVVKQAPPQKAPVDVKATNKSPVNTFLPYFIKV